MYYSSGMASPAAFSEIVHIGNDTETNLADLGKLVLRVTDFHPKLEGRPTPPDRWPGAARTLRNSCPHRIRANGVPGARRTPHLRVVQRALECRLTVGMEASRAPRRRPAPHVGAPRIPDRGARTGCPYST